MQGPLRWALALWILPVLISCRKGGEPEDLTKRSWREIERLARGQTVTWMMWQGDPLINRYVQGFVVPRLKRDYGVTLRTVSGQGSTIVTALMTEKEAGKGSSAVDMVWINGETFYQLRQIDVLGKGLTDSLPNAQLIDFTNPFVRYDFQQEIQGLECPWGNVQLCLIYDSRRVTAPPRTRVALEAWVRGHPGRFTLDTAFTGMTFLKSLLIEIAGGPESLEGPFDEERYKIASAGLWEYLNRIKPFFWRRGETFPSSVAQLHQLFASGEVDFTMSNNDGEVDNKVLQGLFPDTARSFVLDAGTIQNSHYLGLVRRAPSSAGALVTINFLISPEAQYEKLKPSVWGDGTVLAVDRLPSEWRERFENVPERRYAPRRAEIQPKALRELDPQYMIRLYEGFRSHVIEG